MTLHSSVLLHTVGRCATAGRMYLNRKICGVQVSYYSVHYASTVVGAVNVHDSCMIGVMGVLC